MAFLRIGKFLRLLTPGKNLVNIRKPESAYHLPVYCVNSVKNFATVSAVNSSVSSSDTLNKSLKKLDNEIRRAGRITIRDLEEILEDIRTNKSVSSSQSLDVIKCCGSFVPEAMPEVRTKLVQKIWKTLTKLNVPMDISHYNALLRVYLENEHTFSPAEFLADLQARGVEPNRVTYQRIISSYCQQGDISGATQILEFMREKQFPMNEIVFNSLIMGHSNCNDLESAAGILGFMAQAGLRPSTDTYTKLLCGFARVGDTEAIEKYILQSEQDEITLLDKDFLEVIYTLAVNGHEAKVDEIIPRLKKNYGYNQDVFNVSLRLINRGQELTAMKLLKTMQRGTRTTGEQTDNGNFLIRQLVKADRSVEQIIKICNELEESGMNSNPLMVAVNTALLVGQVETSKTLLKELSKKGVEMRQHYFWPILAKAKSKKEIANIIKMMKEDFNMAPNDQTIREYVIPKILKNDDYANAIKTICSYGISLRRAAAASAFVAISKNHLAKAADIMNHYEMYYAPNLMITHLKNALHRSNDFESYIKIIRSIVDNLDRKGDIKSRQLESEEEEGNEVTESFETSNKNVQSIREKQAEVVGDFIIDALLYFKRNRVEIGEKILRGLVDQGLSINSHKAKRIQNLYGENLTNEMSTLLGKLASGELEPIPVEKKKGNFPSYSKMHEKTPEEYERLITRINERGIKANSLKHEWLISAIRSKNVTKTEEIVSKLKSEGYVISAGVNAQMIELYSSEDRPDDALEMLRTLRETDPEFILDNVKMIKIMQSLVNADRISEAIKFAEQNKSKETKDENLLHLQDTCWRLLNSLAEKGKVDELNELFETLVASGYIIPNNALLGPLIKVHLVQDDVKAALDKFEELCQRYRATPYKDAIASRLVQSEDAVNLQRLVNLSTEIHGGSNSLYDLVFTLIECGRIRQARKILVTPGLRTRQDRINAGCERYFNQSMTKALEGLVEATKDLDHIDRAEIYNTLLKTYIKGSAPEKGFELWTTMQEEGETPSDTFLIELADFLKVNELEVPFQIPSSNKVETKQKTPIEEIQEADGEVAHKSEKKKFLNNFKEIESLLKTENLKEATKLVFEMLDKKTYPVPKIFRFYLNKLATSGDTATFEKLTQILSSEEKKRLLFNNRLCKSYINSGKVEEYLDKLEKLIDDSKTPEDLKTADEEFPRVGAAELLESNPELAPRFEKIAIKYADKQILGPINVLWMHFFIQNDPRADDLFKRYFNDSPRLLFNYVLKKAREDQDEILVQRLIQNLSNTKVLESAIGLAYSCLIDIHSVKGNADACLTTITDCIKEVCLENVNRTALLRAKDCVEKAGEKFPHIIPDKKTSKEKDSSSSSSSSSSDDEVTRKNKSLA